MVAPEFLRFQEVFARSISEKVRAATGMLEQDGGTASGG
jgi:hypothetical protein